LWLTWEPSFSISQSLTYIYKSYKYAARNINEKVL